MLNICSDDLNVSKQFYTTLFDFEVRFVSDWFVHLVSKHKSLELGIIAREHELVPVPLRGTASGLYLTLVVEDADAVYTKARQLDYEVLQVPKDTFYGQRRLLLKDPDGAMVDVSSPIANVMG